MRRLLPFAFAALAAGCSSSFKMTPSGSPSVPSASATLPLKAGVSVEQASVTGDFFVWNGNYARNAQDTAKQRFGERLAHHLRQSKAFAEVRYPVSWESDADVIVRSKLNMTFTADPGWRGKAFFTGFTFFLAGAVIRYTDSYNGQAEASVIDAERRERIRSSHNQQVSMEHMMILPGPALRMMDAGAEAAVDHLAAQIASELVNQLGSLKGAPKSSGRGAAAAAAAPPAAAAAEPASSGSSASTPAAEPAAAPAPKPRPVERPTVARSEIAELDRQLLP